MRLHGRQDVMIWYDELAAEVHGIVDAMPCPAGGVAVNRWTQLTLTRRECR